MNIKTIFCSLCTLTVMVLSFTSIRAQVDTGRLSYVPLGSTYQIAVPFKENLTNINLSQIILFYEDSGGNIVQRWATASKINYPSFDVVSITNFRGSPTGGTLINDLRDEISAGQSRTYQIVLKGIETASGAKAKRLQRAITLVSKSEQPPTLSMRKITTSENRKEIIFQPVGITPQTFENEFRNNPNKNVIVEYDFSPNDTIVDFKEPAVDVRVNPNNTNTVIVTLPVALPRRTEDYSVAVKFPVDVLRGKEQTNFLIPSDEETLDAGADVKLPVNVPTRDNAEYYLEATFSSVKKEQNGNRTNAGIFGVRLKPTIKTLSFNTGVEDEGRPYWVATRPFFEADVDTLPQDESESPNRIKFGIDFEYGQNVGIARNDGWRFLQFFVWNNGFHYDSDRDFKLQTAYWQTEFVPRFLNFEKTREQTLDQFRFSSKGRLPNTEGRQPLVSAYWIRPSIGYQLGGVVKRNEEDEDNNSDFPSDKISRLISRFDSGIEFKRTFRLSFDNTYYFIENARRRKSRNYYEARFELNAGQLFNFDLGRFQSAITFKYQRGNQAPTFNSVNAFSAGFKVFK